MTRITSLLLAALLLAGCTEADLYGKGLDDVSADRLGLTGRTCTDDAREAGFPVRVLFLVDVAAGSMFTEADPELARLRALSETVSRHVGGAFSFAVASFGPYGRLLAPMDGGFTQNPGLLDGAISTLGLPQGCLDARCRDYGEGLEVARSVIEGDLARLSAGQRQRTEYVVVLVGGGSPAPLQGTWQEAAEALVADVVGLRDAVADQGALSFRMHTVHLRGDVDGDEADQTGEILEQMAFAGAGRFEDVRVPDAFSLERFDLAQASTQLEVKSLLVTNVSVLPGAAGAEMDSDGDGLSDSAEQDLGTDPRVWDSDEDGVGDLIELLVSLDPTAADPAPTSCEPLGPPPWGDRDTDLLNDCEELLLGTDSSLPDTDGDALPDLLEVVQRTDYLHPDALYDADWDGIANGAELLGHTDPGSSDANSLIGERYRYDVDRVGRVLEASVRDPILLTGIEVVAAGSDTRGGLGALRYEPGSPGWLRWRSPLDESFGPAVAVDGAAPLRLESSSVASQATSRWIDAQVTPVELPPGTTEELLLVELTDRDCVDWTVRNIRLMPTLGSNGDDGGWNDVFVFFAQAPQGRTTDPGLFRLAHVPVWYHPTGVREPSEPIVSVADGEFTTIGE